MRIFSKKTLRLFWLRHAGARLSLELWHDKARLAKWCCFQDVKLDNRSADCLPNNRVVFNIKGNTYRLVVEIHYNTGRVYIRFIGTHAEYDKINAETI